MRPVCRVLCGWTRLAVPWRSQLRRHTRVSEPSCVIQASSHSSSLVSPPFPGTQTSTRRALSLVGCNPPVRHAIVHHCPLGFAEPRFTLGRPSPDSPRPSAHLARGTRGSTPAACGDQRRPFPRINALSGQPRHNPGTAHACFTGTANASFALPHQAASSRTARCRERSCFHRFFRCSRERLRCQQWRRPRPGGCCDPCCGASRQARTNEVASSARITCSPVASPTLYRFRLWQPREEATSCGVP